MHTDGCHLCELAEEILNDINIHERGFDYEKFDISTSDKAIEDYGIRIPVLVCEDGESELKELGWPFDVHQCLTWLTRYYF